MTPDQYRQSVIQAIKDHPDIASAAITGSLARRIAIDQFSDMDVLLVVRDVTAIAKVNSWLPNSERIVINAFHLSNYCTVLLNDFRKIDIAIFSTDDPPSRWVIHEYEVIKGDEKFQERLADAAAQTRQKSAAYLNPDLSVDNVLLLLVTACHRVGRGELLSAHGFVSMACDMLIALEVRERGAHPNADLLDPRRRLELQNPRLAVRIHECLFGAPGAGIYGLARHLSDAHRDRLTEAHMKVVNYLLDPNKHLP